MNKQFNKTLVYLSDNDWLRNWLMSFGWWAFIKYFNNQLNHGIS